MTGHSHLLSSKPVVDYEGAAYPEGPVLETLEG